MIVGKKISKLVDKHKFKRTICQNIHNKLSHYLLHHKKSESRLKVETLYLFLCKFQKILYTIARKGLQECMEILVYYVNTNTKCFSSELRGNLKVMQGFPLSPIVFGLCINHFEYFTTLA